MSNAIDTERGGGSAERSGLNAYVAAGDVSNAIDTLREAVEVKRRRWWARLGRVLNDLGNAYVAAGDVSNAIDTLREAVEAGATQWWTRLGSCAERSGQCVCGSW